MSVRARNRKKEEFTTKNVRQTKQFQPEALFIKRAVKNNQYGTSS